MLLLLPLCLGFLTTLATAAQGDLSSNVVSCFLGFKFEASKKATTIQLDNSDLETKLASVIGIQRIRVSVTRKDHEWEYNGKTIYLQFHISKPRFVSELANDLMAQNVNRFMFNSRHPSTRAANKFVSSSGEAIVPYDAAAEPEIKLASYIGDICTQVNYCPIANTECRSDPNSYNGEISRCECYDSYIAVNRQQCLRKITSETDSGCIQCEQTEGQCYEKTNGDVGCSCPFWRAKLTSSSLQCVKEYMKLYCRKSEMTVCLKFDKILEQIGIIGGGSVIGGVNFTSSTLTPPGPTALMTQTTRSTVQNSTTRGPNTYPPVVTTANPCTDKIGVDNNMGECGKIEPVPGTDKTLEPCNIGCDVVAAVTTKVERYMIFDDDREFMRRIAFAESKNGELFCSNGGRHGIWQVSQADLTSTQSNSQLTISRNKIFQSFGIKWDDVKVEDLRKPFYSGLTAYLKIKASNQAIPVSLSGQALLWKSIYNSNLTQQDFINADAQMKLKCDDCKQVTGADIVFVVDGSGSVGTTGFAQSRNFLKAIVNYYNKNGWETRFSVIIYSSSSSVVIKLNQYSSTTALINAINNIGYPGGGTQTDEAINQMTTSAFSTPNGARPDSAGITKIGIIVTDGASNNQVLTCRRAEEARTRGITLLAIGVGNVDQDEMKCIVGDGNHDKILSVNNYDSVQHIDSAIKTISCKTSVDIVTDKIEGTMDQGQRKFFKKQINKNVGSQVVFKATAGRATIYIGTFPNPNSVLYDWTAEAAPGTPAVINITPEKLQMVGEVRTLLIGRSGSSLTLYGTVIAKRNETEFSMEVNDQPEDESCQFRLVTSATQKLCSPGEHRLNLPYEPAEKLMQCNTRKFKYSQPVRTAYKNEIVIQQSNLLMTRFAVQCDYQNGQSVSGKGSLMTRSEFIGSKIVYKSATIEMRLLDKDFIELRNNATVKFGDEIKIAVEMVDANDAFKAIKVQSCHVSSTSNFQTSKALVRNSCVAPHQNFLKPQNSFKRVARDPRHLVTSPKGMSMFRFSPDSWNLYFKCEVKICQRIDACGSTQCFNEGGNYESFGRRRRRRAADSGSTVPDSDEIPLELNYVIKAVEADEPTRQTDVSQRASNTQEIFATSLAAAGVFIVIAILVATLVYKNRAKKGKRVYDLHPNLASRPATASSTENGPPQVERFSLQKTFYQN